MAGNTLHIHSYMLLRNILCEVITVSPLMHKGENHTVGTTELGINPTCLHTGSRSEHHTGSQPFDCTEWMRIESTRLSWWIWLECWDLAGIPFPPLALPSHKPPFLFKWSKLRLFPHSSDGGAILSMWFYSYCPSCENLEGWDAFFFSGSPVP